MSGQPPIDLPRIRRSQQLRVLAINTFREAVRDRILHSILFFSLATVLLSLGLKEVTIGDQEKVVRSIAQGSIDIFASVIALFLGISAIWKELDKKTIYTILSKPIPRWLFVLGKYSGLVLTVTVQIGLMTAVYVVLMTTQQSFPPAVFFVSVGLLWIEMLLLLAFATLCSAYSAPTTAAAFALSVFAIGHLADDIWLFGSQAQDPNLRFVAKLLYWVLPNFEVLSIRPQAVHHRAVPWGQVGYAVAYGLSYSVLVLAFAISIFRRRDIR